MRGNEDLIAIYSRKSKFTGKGESIGNQIEMCREYIRNQFGEDAVERCTVFEDEGFSGGDLNRPAFQSMMEQVRKRKFKAIVVYRLDRISRNTSDFASLVDELGRMNVSFISIREQFDTTSPMGRAMMFIISVFSQLERETIAERIRDNMHELAKTGRWLGGNTPTGFRSEGVCNVTVDGKSRKSYKLVPIEEEAQLVRTVFDLYKETDSLTAVEAELIRRRLKTKQGKDFTRFAVKAILQNPVYMVADQNAYRYFTQRQAEVCFAESEFDGSCGIMAYNRTDQEKGKATILLPVEQWIIAKGKHQGLISSRDWIHVQESLERNKVKSYRKPRQNKALLTGLLYCACGDRMYPKLTKRQTAQGDTVFTYLCKMKERSKGEMCSMKNLNGNILDAAVIEQLKSLTEDNSAFLQQLEKYRSSYTGSQDRHDAQLTNLRAEYSKNQKQMEGLLDALSVSGDSIARPSIMARLESLVQTNREIENRIQELAGLDTENALGDEIFDALCRMLRMFRSCIDGMTLEEKRAAVRTLVRKVVWDGKNIHLILFGAEEAELEFPDLSDRMENHDGKYVGNNTQARKNTSENTQMAEKSPTTEKKAPWGEGSE